MHKATILGLEIALVLSMPWFPNKLKIFELKFNFSSDSGSEPKTFYIEFMTRVNSKINFILGFNLGSLVLIFVESLPKLSRFDTIMG